MSASQRLYDLLGVKKGSSHSDVRKAYRDKAKRTHPDAGGEIADFQEVSKAWAILGDPVKRLIYDQTGKEDDAPAAEDAATVILRNLVEMVINGTGDPKYADVVKEMRKPLDDGLREAQTKKADIKRRIARCEELAKRFERRAGDNLVRRMIEARVVDMERQLTQVVTEQVHVEAAIALLETYRYQVDAKPQQQPSYQAFCGMQSAAQAAAWYPAGAQS